MKCESSEAKLNSSSNKPNPVMIKPCEVQTGQPNALLSTNSTHKKYIEMYDYTGGRSCLGKV